ncbi:hypothetical protein IJ182_02470 [bacterium]|nr:hypothetical protein [bacterium]
MKKLLAIFFIIFATAGIAKASGGFGAGAYDAGSLNRDYVRDMRIHEVSTREKNRNSAIISTKTTPKTQEQVISSDIKSIVFVNNNSIPSSQLQAVVRDKINQPMTQENISAIRKDIMRYYQNQGFFSAVALVASQDTQTGELVIEIKEGGKNSIQIEF